MIAIFCGSRDWADSRAVEEVMRALTGWGLYMVIEGEQRGADRRSGDAADGLGLGILPVPADWDRLGPRAGPHRNGMMLAALLAARDKYGQEVVCVAFHEDPGLGSGTRDMVARCLAAGVPALAWVDPRPPDGPPCGCGRAVESHPVLLPYGGRLSCAGAAMAEPGSVFG